MGNLNGTEGTIPPQGISSSTAVFNPAKNYDPPKHTVSATTIEIENSSGSSTESGFEAMEVVHEPPESQISKTDQSVPKEDSPPKVDANYMMNKLRTSEEQIDIIIEMWKRTRLKGRNQPGASILAHIVITHPALKQVFYGDSKQEVYFSDFDMSMHAQRFTSALDDVITNLKNPSLAIEKLQALGARHVNARKLGFQPEYWNAFAQALITHTMDWRYVPTAKIMMVRHTWIKIVGEIMRVMKDAYSAELAKRGEEEEEEKS